MLAPWQTLPDRQEALGRAEQIRESPAEMTEPVVAPVVGRRGSVLGLHHHPDWKCRRRWNCRHQPKIAPRRSTTMPPQSTRSPSTTGSRHPNPAAAPAREGETGLAAPVAPAARIVPVVPAVRAARIVPVPVALAVPAAMRLPRDSSSPEGLARRRAPPGYFPSEGSESLRRSRAGPQRCLDQESARSDKADWD